MDALDLRGSLGKDFLGRWYLSTNLNSGKDAKGKYEGQWIPGSGHASTKSLRQYMLTMFREKQEGSYGQNIMNKLWAR